MPRLTDPEIVQQIVERLIEFPEMTYTILEKEIKAEFAESPSLEGIRRIAERECPKRDPNWVKVNSLIREYRCQFRLSGGRRHLKKFKGERGYSGDNAHYCPEHRTGKTATK